MSCISIASARESEQHQTGASMVSSDKLRSILQNQMNTWAQSEKPKIPHCAVFPVNVCRMLTELHDIKACMIKDMLRWPTITRSNQS